MNPNEINKLKEKAPLPVFILVVLFFLPALLVGPENDLLVENGNKYDAQLKRSRIARRKKTQYKIDNEKMAKLNDIHGKINEQLPAASVLPGIIESINEAAEQNQVLLKNVNYKFNDSFDGLKVPNFNITMNLEAYYENIRRFITRIENLQYPLVVAEVFVSEGKTYSITLKQLVK
jgi:Tfp pilus assembly protein PilO